MYVFDKTALALDTGREIKADSPFDWRSAILIVLTVVLIS